MSDPFSIASGAAGIITLEFMIAQGLFQIANVIGSAGQEVRFFAEEINAFSKLLKYVKTELESSIDVSVDLQSLVKDVIDICDRVLTPLDHLQNTLRPLLVRFRNSSQAFRQLGLRLRWVFTNKDKLLFYREVLRGQHRILDTTLEVILLQTTRDRSAPNICIMQLSLENSVVAVDLSYRAPRQSDFKMRFEESSPDTGAMTRGMQSSHETIDEPFDPGPDPESHERASENQDALVKFSAVPNDRIPAISGIVGELARHWKDRYIAGTWQDTIVHDLAWYIGNQPVVDKFEAVALNNNLEGSSWSWISYNSKVTFYRMVNIKAKDLSCSMKLLNPDLPFADVKSDALVINCPSVSMVNFRGRVPSDPHSFHFDDGSTYNFSVSKQSMERDFEIALLGCFGRQGIGPIVQKVGSAEHQRRDLFSCSWGALSSFPSLDFLGFSLDLQRKIFKII